MREATAESARDSGTRARRAGERAGERAGSARLLQLLLGLGVEAEIHQVVVGAGRSGRLAALQRRQLLLDHGGLAEVHGGRGRGHHSGGAVRAQTQIARVRLLVHVAGRRASVQVCN